MNVFKKNSKQISELLQKIEKQEAELLVNAFRDIGLDYISNPRDAVNFVKEINLFLSIINSKE